MCLIILAHHTHPRIPLVLTANRDEFFSRPTRPAEFWTECEGNPKILAGKDLTLGGTWLGLTNTGRFAAVTNIRNPDIQTPNSAKSRGLLTLDFLTGERSAESYVDHILESGGNYAGFNLLVGDLTNMIYVTNQSTEPIVLKPGIYGLSNGILDDPWPKVSIGKSALQQLLNRSSDPKPEALLDIMTNRDIAPDSELPQTGVPLALERTLSPSFILDRERDYGTRCTTALTISDSNQVQFCEQNYNNDTSIQCRRLFSFELSPA